MKNQIVKWTSIFTLCTVILVSFGGLKQVHSQKIIQKRVLKSYEKEEVAKLERQLLQLETLSSLVFSTERARVYILKLATIKIISLINNVGLLHQNTNLAYQSYILRYRFSNDLFKHIRLNQTNPKNATHRIVADILAIYSQVEKERGLNGSNLYSHFTEDIFKQIKELLQNASKIKAYNGDLQKIFNTLIAPTGKLLAKARQGDRPSVFAEGKKLYEQYKVYYPQFFTHHNNNKTFDLIFQIQGLLELFAEFAEVDWQKTNLK